MSGLKFSHLSCPTVTLEVGPDKVPIRVPKILLTEASPFFDRALNGLFKESKGDTIPLPKDEPDIVFRLAKWIITREVDGRDDIDAQDDCSMRYANAPEEQQQPHGSPDDNDGDGDESDNVSLGSRAEEEGLLNDPAPGSTTTPNPHTSTVGANALFRLWCLAERLLMPELQDAVAQTLVYNTATDAYSYRDPVPSPETLTFVYQNSPDTARVRDLAVDMAAVTWETDELKALSEGLPAEIARDLFVAAAKYWRMETANHEPKRAAFFRGAAVDAYAVRGLPRELRTEPALRAPVCHAHDMCRNCWTCGSW